MRKLFSYVMLMAVGLLISGNVGAATTIAARIGSTSYELLDDAVGAANTLAAEGEEVTITIINQRVFTTGSCDFPWEINESMTIDLNGKSIDNPAFSVAAGKVLSIIDNAGGGTLGYSFCLFEGDGKYSFPNGFILGDEWNAPTDCSYKDITASYFSGKLEECTAADQDNGTIIFSASGTEESNCTINSGQRKNITSLDNIPSGTTSIVFDENQSLTLDATTYLSGITIDLNGSTVTMAEGKDFQIDGTVTIQSGTLTGNAGDLIQMNESANLTLDNVIVNNTQSSSYTIIFAHDASSASVTFNGTTQEGYSHTIYANNPSGAITINSGCIVNFNACEFVGANDLTLINYGTLNICGGKYQGTLNASSKVGTVHKTCEPSSMNAAFQDAFFPEPVAKVNGEGSYTLSQALEIAQAGNTITLTKAVTLSGTLTISKNVTLDLGGFAMTTGDNKISVANNVTIQNGTLKNNSGKYAILTNSANAAITLGSGLKFDYPEYAIEERQSANVTVSAGVTAQVTFNSGQGTDFTNSINITNAGTLTIKAGTLQQLAIDNSGSCTIKNATIANQISFTGSEPVVILDGKYQDAIITGTASVQGGYFKLADKTWLEENLAEGYAYTKTLFQSNEVYQVALASNFVAQVGDYKYTTLATAVATIPDNVKTELIILNDCEATNITLSANKDVVLMLGNKTITNSVATTPIFTVQGTLEVNAATQNGEFASGFVGNEGGIIKVANNATVIVNGGKFTSNAAGTSGSIRAIFNLEGGNLTINNGVFVGSPLNTYQGSIIEARNNNQTNIIINAGVFSAVSEVSASEGQSLIYFAPSANAGSTLKIIGGEFKISRDKEIYSGNGNFTCVEADGQYNSLIITGGTFENATPAEYVYTGHEGYFNALMVYNNFKSVTIKNAAFKSYGKAVWIYAQSTGLEQCDIQDATFISQVDKALEIGLHKAGQKVNIAGGTYRGENGIVIGGNDNLASTIEISNCNIEATNNGIHIANTQSTAYISGGTISGATGILMAAKGTLNISGNVTIIGSQYGVYNYNAESSISISGGRIKATADNGSVTYNAAGSFMLTGGIYNIKPVIDGAVAGHVTLGEGLSIIEISDQATKDLGYLWTVGKETGTIIIGDGATTDWATNTTWTDGTNNVVPTIADNVTIPAGKEVIVGESGHTDAVANTVTISGIDESNQGKLRVKTGNSLTVAQLLTVGNQESQYGKAVVEAGGRLIVGDASDQMVPNIVLEDDGEHGTGVMLFNPDNTVGDVQATIELRPKAHKNSDGTYLYSYIGIPLKLNAGEFNPDNWERTLADESTGEVITYLKEWDLQTGWQDITALGQLVPLKGFAISNESSKGVVYRFKGTMLGNADQTMNFGKRGYNFFGNSYTAPIDIKTMLTALKANDKVNATIYMFDEENEAIQSVGLGAFGGFFAPKFRVIPVMQGFFILNETNNTPSEIVNYADAVYNCNIGNRPIYAPAHEVMDFSRVHITMTGASGKKDAMYLIENEDFTADFENGYDEVKYINTGKINIFGSTSHGRQSAVFSDDLHGTVLGFIANDVDAVYTLSFDEVQGTIYELTDLMTGATIRMDGTQDYTFTVAAGSEIDNRFMVRRITGTPTGLNQVTYKSVPGVYTITGQFMGTVANWHRLPQGVYVVDGVKMVK